MNAKLTYNAVKCLRCDTILESTHRHDFRSCHCPNRTFVDGGHDYQRFGGVNIRLIQSLAEYESDPSSDTPDEL